MPTLHETKRSDPAYRHRRGSGPYWAQSHLIGPEPVLAETPECILAAALPGYDGAWSSADRLGFRRELAVLTAKDAQATAIRAAENGSLGKPWALVAQSRFVRHALTADRGAPPGEYVNVWPTDQPRLVLAGHLLPQFQVARGNVLVLDSATARSFLNSLARAGVLAWGEI